MWVWSRVGKVRGQDACEARPCVVGRGAAAGVCLGA